MALAFGASKGKAISNKVESYEYQDGENVIRLVGGVLPRYIYWIKGTNNKDIPVECLSFNREKEKFDNLETDHVPKFHPLGRDGKPIKCSWSYVMNCLDVKQQKVVNINLKKKLFDQIKEFADQVGADITDPDVGYDLIFKKVKTGPLPINVEYTLLQLKSKARPLTEDERKLVAEAKTVDEKFPRPTPDEVKALLEKIRDGNEESEEGAGEDTPAGEAARELG